MSEAKLYTAVVFNTNDLAAPGHYASYVAYHLAATSVLEASQMLLADGNVMSHENVFLCLTDQGIVSLASPRMGYMRKGEFENWKHYYADNMHYKQIK